LVGLVLSATSLLSSSAAAASPLFEKVDLFVEGQAGFVSYRIPGIVVTANGTVLAYCEARKFTSADRGELEIHLRRSTDAGRTWSPPQQIAHLAPRLPRNPHMPDDKKKKNMGGPEEQTRRPGAFRVLCGIHAGLPLPQRRRRRYLVQAR
jgi:sialidase-1